MPSDNWVYDSGKKIEPDYFDSFPAIFRKLQWWKDRRSEDMPEYVKFADDRNSVLSIGGEDEPDIHKVKHHWTTSPKMDFHSSTYNAFVSEWNNQCYSYSMFFPATESEYIKSKTP